MCQFTTKYWKFERQAVVDYNCPDHEETLGSGRCILHDIYYLQDYLFSFREEKKRNVRDEKTK